ncbi:hypothetical protein [Paenibacillus sp. VMFN-D1]|uniref:hypothetical protein n=1 Tax=Paenibacillus sp. VMFN-D1 TaxID=2135608 RepID=UPI000E22DF5B|nr:hypothetical protein [Paenibacillus sp. VMFN-D1]
MNRFMKNGANLWGKSIMPQRVMNGVIRRLNDKPGTFFPYKEFENKTEYYRLFFRHFIKGYLKENTIQEEEIVHLQDVIKLRYALLYIYFHQANDVSDLDEQSMNWLKELQRVAASDEPMLPIDFVQEYKSIH